MPYLCVLFFVACLSISCGSDNDSVVNPDPTPVTPTGDDDNSDTNASAETVAMHNWMLQQMKARYLWKEDIPSSVTTDTEDTQAFFESMLSQNDGKHTSTSDYFYSNIEKDPKYTSTRALQSGDTYGMWLVWYRVVNTDESDTGHLAARILYVCDDSSAAQAGLERGDWIRAISESETQKDITSDNWMTLSSGSGIGLYVAKNWKAAREEDKLVTLSASREMTISPVFRSAVVEQGGKKIGYLCYNAFLSGVTSFETFEYDDALIEVFNSFKTQQIDELVLDLRYNGGGSLQTAGMLAYMIAPSSSLNDPIWILTEQDGNERSYKMSTFIKRYKDGTEVVKDLDLPNLNLSNLYCLVSSNTASASEAVANGLKPYMNVTLIGKTTEGKDVGMDPIRDSENKYPYYMWPITFRITSTDTSFHYSDGLVPDATNDLDETSNDSIMYPLGDPQEILFARAVELITGTTTTRAVKETSTHPSVRVEVPAYSSLRNRPWYERNALMIPIEETKEAN